jgi:hypothetical protein
MNTVHTTSSFSYAANLIALSALMLQPKLTSASSTLSTPKHHTLQWKDTATNTVVAQVPASACPHPAPAHLHHRAPC